MSNSNDKENGPNLKPFPLDALNLPVKLPLKTDEDLLQMEQWLRTGSNGWYLMEYLRVRINNSLDLYKMFTNFLSVQLIDDYTLAMTPPQNSRKERKYAKDLVTLYGIWKEVAEIQVKDIKPSTAVSRCYQRHRDKTARILRKIRIQHALTQATQLEYKNAVKMFAESQILSTPRM